MDTKESNNRKNLTNLQQEISKQRAALQEQSRLFQETIAQKTALEKQLKKDTALAIDKQKLAAQASNLKDVNAKVDAIKDSISQLKNSLGDLLGKIVIDTDPRSQVSLMDDQFPVLLLPVRVETRFMIIKHIARIGRDKLPKTPGKLTVIKGRNVEKPVNFGVKELYPNYSALPVVEDINELWIRIFPDDIAIHTHEEELTEIEISAGQSFWTQMWYAGNDNNLGLSAWRVLINGRTPERAAWISKQMTPVNQASAPTAPVDRAKPLPVQPQFPTPAQKATSWSQAPHSRVMPDRFIVRLYTGATFREVAGKSIPDQLPVSLDPQDDGSGLDNTDGKLVLPENLWWVQDFDEAEKIGMAIRVPLSLAERTKGFTKLLVLGVKTSADKDATQKLVEELVDNHHYKPGGLSVVPQGTPTNNTEDSLSGYTANNADDDALFNIELGAPQFTQLTADEDKTDGQRLAEALGIGYEKLQHTRYAGITDIKEAICMNKALWPTTLGYYLSQLMQPLFSDQDILNTKSHFSRFVLGRGRLPAIRVDDQPYGILPTTAFSKLTYTSVAATGNNIFLGNMLNNVLKKMEVTWDTLSLQVKHADQGFTSNTDKAFLEILGLHPASVEFYQRYVTGPYFLWNLYSYSLLIQKAATIPTSVSYANILDFTGMFHSLNFLFTTPPRVFNFVYSEKEKHLDGPIIDIYPFSEKRTLNMIGSNGENYIDWLNKSDFTTISNEDFSNIGAAGIIPPKALLYLMLRHSCLLEYVHTGINTLINRKLLSPDAILDIELGNIATKTLSPEIQSLVRTRIEMKEGTDLHNRLNADVEAEFIKRANAGSLAGMNAKAIQTARTNYYNQLKTAAVPAFNTYVNTLVQNEINTIQFTTSKTGTLATKYDFIGDAVNLAQYIDLGIKKPVVDNELQDMLELRNALTCLSKLSTASLERLFSEHVDLASYRLDAWFFSLAAQRLENLRNSGTQRQTGIYIGSYSWLENVVPGVFPGVAYREVDIQPTIFTIPGIQEVTLQNIELPAAVAPGPVPPFFVYKKNTAAVARAAAPPSVVKGKAMTFQKGEVAATNPIVDSGGVSMVLDTTRDTVLVNFPDLFDVPEIVNVGPGFIYLGSADPGSVTYDSAMDKFISNPRIDPSNQGYIHAPSVNHASTAALLRSGYESHKVNPGSNADAFAVNLSSDRVRRALTFLEGIRNGQELAALLGYQFERELHDLNLNLDQYIRDIRLKYPFVAARVTESTGAQDINEAEAYNVVDGLKLMEAYRDNQPHWADGVVFNPATDQQIVEQSIQRLMDTMDAIHDLLLTECIHQAVQGNTARSNAAFNAISGTSVPPEPHVVQTPRNFHALTNRIGVIFDPAAGGEINWTTIGTARSWAEPKLNKWLAGELPAKEKIVINCSFTNTSGIVTDFNLNAGELNIEPIDLLYLMDISLEDDLESDLYELISYHIRLAVAHSDEITIRIKNADRTGLDISEITLAELKPLSSALLMVVQNGKPLDARDFMLETDADTEIAANPTAGLKTASLLARLQNVAGAAMSNGQKGLGGLVTELTDAINALAANVPAFANTFDENQYIRLRNAMLNANYFGVVRSIPTTALSYSVEDARVLLAEAGQALTILSKKNQTATQLLSSVAAQTSEDAKLKILLQAGEAIFGRGFKLYPDFNFYTPAAVIAANAYTGLLTNAGPHAVEEWIQGLAPVRKRMHALQQWQLFAEVLTGVEKKDPFKVTQFPLTPVDENGNVQSKWVGMKLPDGYDVPDNNLSLLFSYPASFDANATHSGMIIDEWVEEIPIARVDTGLAVNYNSPNAETPNVCLLAVSPDLNGSWSWDDLMSTLDETLAWAKKRAVDPDLLNNSPFAQLLPTIMAALSGSDDTPTLDFGRNAVPKPQPGRLDLIKLDDYKLTIDI
ncbi:hypothetical protein QTN47_11275 [Danxiaibacter flavus]|uniref:Uncharacterized protein n=1 Tax=Danxiaibacter flavus TaxID=3049108 RepID=A0ABV3ZF12_9BACT|nr:hypothetical protein QNM32_11280 [Chitinophagaceae bacterium DXS]